MNHYLKYALIGVVIIVGATLFVVWNKTTYDRCGAIFGGAIQFTTRTYESSDPLCRAIDQTSERAR